MASNLSQEKICVMFLGQRITATIANGRYFLVVKFSGFPLPQEFTPGR
jgi:hypothetical protein